MVKKKSVTINRLSLSVMLATECMLIGTTAGKHEHCVLVFCEDCQEQHLLATYFMHTFTFWLFLLLTGCTL